ncbi:MAG: DUF6703 family protein, partial [Nocardioidaceae bacterium]
HYAVVVANGKRGPTSKRTGASRPQGRRPPSTSRSQPVRTSPVPASSGDTALRTAVAERSRGIVVWFSSLPQFAIPGAMVALMAVGLAAPLVVALPALLLILVFIGWLAFLSWPVIAGGQRAVRLVAIGLVVLAVAGRLAGWF